MGRKRKSTVGGKTPPSKGRPCCKSVVAPSPVAVEAPEPAAASSTMVPHHHPKGGPGLLKQARSAVAVSAAKEKVVKLNLDVPMRVLNCDVCHGLLKAPIFQCSLLRHVACGSCSEFQGGSCRPCADLAASAVYVQSSYLDTLFGYIKEACPYKKYGCTSTIVVGNLAAAHRATCKFEPCWCTRCSFKGSSADLAREPLHAHARLVRPQVHIRPRLHIQHR
uniref:SIAH-type domain-containing protein n=1 Tax=Triticum urartu TaxID=4572 RepID=A0A8R7V1B4_TRIUA